MICVFLCVFNQVEYVDMLFVLLESIFIYGQLDDTIDILIYTSTPFMKKIKQSHLFNDNIKFEINDTYNSVDSACKARLDLFYLQSVNNYSKVLYLDTDIIIKGDVKQIFDVCKSDVLYVLEEATIDNDTDWWGKSLFGSEIEKYSDKTAFTSGILLFNNCETIRTLFNDIKTHIEDDKKNNREHQFHDQPYIIYNAFKYNLYDNKTLKSLVVNNCDDINSCKIIHHFPGAV
jgi:lipopolysaccharide biosynthesis glycosyltransferase